MAQQLSPTARCIQRDLRHQCRASRSTRGAQIDRRKSANYYNACNYRTGYTGSNAIYPMYECSWHRRGSVGRQVCMSVKRLHSIRPHLSMYVCMWSLRTSCLGADPIAEIILHENTAAFIHGSDQTRELVRTPAPDAGPACAGGCGCNCSRAIGQTIEAIERAAEGAFLVVQTNPQSPSRIPPRASGWRRICPGRPYAWLHQLV